jgi:hypothetical protein
LARDRIILKIEFGIFSDVQSWLMSEQASTNSVTLTPEGYVLVELVGDQTFLTMEELGKDCKNLADRLRAENKPVIGLIDFTRDTTFNPGTNKAAMEALEAINYDKAAMYGLKGVLTEVTKAMVSALGKSDRTRVFANKQEALAWLLIRDPIYGYRAKED